MKMRHFWRMLPILLLPLGACDQDPSAPAALAPDAAPSAALAAGTVTPMVVSGSDQSCALTSEGTLKCWGDLAAFTDGTSSGHGSLTHAGSYLDVSTALRDRQTCAVTETGSIACWGANTHGQVPPTRDPPAGVTYTKVSTGLRHSCALRNDAAVVCWGDDTRGRVSGTTAFEYGGYNEHLHTGPFTDVSAGDYVTCAVKAGSAQDGVLCWGNDYRGQRSGSQTYDYDPYLHAGNYLQVDLGVDHACALEADGDVRCWGYDYDGQVSGTPFVNYDPTVHTHVGPAVRVSAGVHHTCSVLASGSLDCWGAGGIAYDYAGLAEDRTSPYGPYVDMGAAWYHNCALRADGGVECWGDWDDGPNTLTGTTVFVTPLDVTTYRPGPVALTFETVTSDGNTTLSSGSLAPGDAPAGFALGDPATYYDVSTTATFTAVEVCISYGGISFADESTLRLLHQDGAGDWTDVTTTHDLSADVICGHTTSLSAFLVAEQTSVNGAPVVTGLTVPVDPVEAGATVVISATFTDADATDTHTATVNWGDGSTTTGTVTEPAGAASGSVTASHAYAAAGDYTVTVTVSDGELAHSLVSTSAVTVFESNTTVGSSVEVSPVDETTGGSPVTLTFAEVTAAGETTVTSGTATDAPTGFALGDPATVFDISTTATFTGTVEVCISYSDGQYADEGALALLHYDSDSGAWVDITTTHDAVLNVICGTTTSLSPFLVAARVNVSPVVTAVILPADPVAVATEAEIRASFTDENVGDTHTATIVWGDGATTTGTVTEPSLGNDGSVMATHAYGVAGVYSVLVTVSDGLAEDSRSSAEEATNSYLVVYDPEGGFVTGGGWFESAPGACAWDACASDGSTAGRASFGFVSKYKKGASAPDGNAEFQFRAADLNFRSTSYDWLVIAGARAQFKGEGSINGIGSYGFFITAIDGDRKDGEDSFRIKIWDRSTETVVYDNQVGEDERSDAATPLGGGSIVIHKK